MMKDFSLMHASFEDVASPHLLPTVCIHVLEAPLATGASHAPIQASDTEAWGSEAFKNDGNAFFVR